MPYAAGLSDHADTEKAVAEVCEAVRAGLNGRTPDLCFLFVTQSHAAKFAEIAAQVVESLAPVHLLGCGGESIAGGSTEIEALPGITLWAAELPGASVQSFHVEYERTADGLLGTGLPDAWDNPDQMRAVFLLGDPWTCAVDNLIERLVDELPGVPLLGGMASLARGPGQNWLCIGSKVVRHGAVGAAISGGPKIHSIVSQGCRPIGTPFIVTKGNDNLILELGGEPALKRLEEIYSDLPDHDKQLVRDGLHIGIAFNEYQSEFRRGDFLVSNVMAFDQNTGAIGIGNHIRVGQTVQFQIRDADTADEDLRHLLDARPTAKNQPVQAALLFSCNGRGSRLFPQPHHDSRVIQELVGPVPLAGFFAQGELGPIGQRNHIHGFTASIALFE